MVHVLSQAPNKCHAVKLSKFALIRHIIEDPGFVERSIELISTKLTVTI
jgi:hypothetical protein